MVLKDCSHDQHLLEQARRPLVREGRIKIGYAGITWIQIKHSPEGINRNAPEGQLA